MANREGSDSEDDPDYLPPGDAESSSSDEEPDAKRARTSSPQSKEMNEADKQKLWDAFQASVATPSVRPSPPSQVMVKIVKRFRFAGEEVTETKEVPEDSEDAKKWPRWRPPEGEDNTVYQPESSAVQSGDTTPSSNATQPPTTPTPAKPPVPAKAAPKRPGPRKPKITLASAPRAAKKLTTLDKSAMDWRAHVDTEGASGLKDELEANRRGGGYLEKVEFLQRVEDRKAGALEASTSKRRRR
ncbi:bucentaur or craniofacial development-domain-containing protein [Sparassis latifolia]